MKYLFDNNISYRYAEMLAALDQDVAAVRHVMEEGTADIELFQWLSGRDMVFVSGEKRIRTIRAELAALKAANVTALFFGPFWSKMLFWDQAIWLVRRWPLIDGFASGAEKGTLAEVKQNGKSVILKI